jgi:hypothetical protein
VPALSVEFTSHNQNQPMEGGVSHPQSKFRRCVWLSILTRSNKHRMYRVITIANMSPISVTSFSNLQSSRERMQSGSAECVFASVVILMPRQVILCQCRRRLYGWNSHFKNGGKRQAGGQRRRRHVLGAGSGDLTFPNGPGRRRKWPKQCGSLSEIP